jgi:tRNA(Ile)-lysidine synthase
VLNKIQKYNKDNELFSKNDKILLAISGGADSVLLFHLFFNLKLNFALAHCNFNLRNDDSKQDEIFVKNLAENYKIDLYVKSFETKEYAKENKVSIEMAARELRYNFFFEIADKHKFTKIATAHHKDDNVETILINLSRKTGLKGLTGIQNKNEKIIRPLLFATKKEIIEYCNINKIIYRTDKTNFETDFYRNKIRLKIIPEFENINPTFVNNVIETAENLKKLQTFFNIYFSEFEKKCISKKDNITTVKIEEIYNYKPIELFLYEYLKKYGFNSVTVSSICNSLEKQSGKEFLSDEYILVKERKELTITKLK